MNIRKISRLICNYKLTIDNNNEDIIIYKSQLIKKNIHK